MILLKVALNTKNQIKSSVLKYMLLCKLIGLINIETKSTVRKCAISRNYDAVIPYCQLVFSSTHPIMPLPPKTTPLFRPDFTCT
jgi:hypothetical protein